MRGDFSRDTFNRARNYSGVLMQQGRVQLDADWNEQSAIVLHHLRALAADLFGPFGGPANPGFKVTAPFTDAATGRLDFQFDPGRYYVDGLMCEAEPTPPQEKLLYSRQPFFPWRSSPNIPAAELALPAEPFFVYLDVWERFVSAVEHPSLREVALNGPDTAGRSQVVWQVKAVKIDATVNNRPNTETCREIQNSAVWQRLSPLAVPAGSLKVVARPQGPSDNLDPCAIPPESRFRGAENQLYRVEIHKGGKAGGATFKWSRDNGSVVYPVISIAGKRVTLEHVGRDERLGLHPGDWVEVLSEDYTLLNNGGFARLQGNKYELLPQDLPLLSVEDVNAADMTVVLSGTPKITAERNDPRRPFLRRWDHAATDARAGNLTLNEGGVVIKEGGAQQNWLTLEDGIQIQFQATSATYRAGDYWLIPARVATGDVEWPRDNDGPVASPPHGIEHHFAPLAIYNGGAGSPALVDLLRTLLPVACRL